MTKIAIIEDETDIAEMYKFKLDQLGYEVKCAVNGKAGLELVTAFRPDLILLDLMMPEMSGEEMLEKLRATDWGKNIKVIILTNITEDAGPSKLNLLDVRQYIVKANYTPVQIAEIVAQELNREADRPQAE
jgi:two-component system phosphate regulon response regulator PhoB